MHFEPARVAWRGAGRSGSVRRPLARASGASSPSAAAIAGAALTVRMRPLKASTSRQWPSARKSAASAASSPEPRACSKRASQWLAIAASVSEPACMRLTSYTIAVQNRQHETGRLGAAEDRSPGGGVAAAAIAAALGALPHRGCRTGARRRVGRDPFHSAGAGRGGDQVTLAQANLQQAAAELRDAEANYKRSGELLAKKYISDAQHEANLARLDKARAAVESQKAALASARANRQAAEVAVEQTLIRAPFDAIVLTKNADVGDNITPFSSAAGAKGAVITVADMQTLEVEADVAESSIGKIRLEQPCEVQLEALPETRLAALVSRIVPTVDRAKATVLVKVRFVDKDARVLPDMSAKVAFLERAPTADEKRAVPAVQARAVVERDGRKQVFAIREGHARGVEVTTGRKLGELVEVRGVDPGERVVLDPAEALRDGAAATVAKK